MLETIRNAFKVKDIRKRLLYMFAMLIVVRIGSQLPIPGVSRDYFKDFFSQQTSALNFFNAMTGGSFTKMSIFALSITPYITSSIIMQLLTIAIPKLEEMQKDGEDGRKKIVEFTRYLNIVLSIIEGAAFAIGFGNSNLLQDGITVKSVTVMVLSLTAGSAFLMWLGEQITEKGIGNGISIILMYNIVSGMPEDFGNLYTTFVQGASSTTNGLLAAVIIIALIVAMVAFIIVLQDAIRKIPVQYAKKLQGRKMVGGQQSFIPLKVNTAGVIPVIFASSLLSLPIIISSFAGIQPASGKGASLWQKILKLCSQGNWCSFKSLGEFKYTLGLLVYIAMVIFFAYFYTNITFNPVEVSANLKKAGGLIPGIRPGKQTTDYLNNVLNNIIFIGAIGLTIIAVVPIFCSGAFNANVGFGGTSLIIVVGVVLETIKQIESQMLVRNYKGFLND